MQPKNKSQESTNLNQDTYPVPGQKSELNPDVTEQQQSSVAGVESTVSSTPERHLSNPEQSTQSQSPTLPAPNDNDDTHAQDLSQNQQTSAVQQQADDTPYIADDVDVIEKEWVDKAKQIIERTKDHPYQQEKEVERLQQSYLKKRYGKDVSSASQA